MSNRLENMAGIVTGAGAGIGRAAALAFAREGAKVMVADVNDEGGKQTVQLIERAGGVARYQHADVSKASDVEKLVGRTVKEFGHLDYAFNNAGIEGDQAPTGETTEKNFDRVIDVNLKGVFLGMRYQIEQMLRQGKGGSIVNTASVGGLIGFPGIPAYVASKHGVVGLTKNAALEYATKGIRVNAVCPGVIKTDMIDRFTGKDPEKEKEFAMMEPVERMGLPEEIAEAAVWLCSKEASFVTGVAMPVDGGYIAR